MDCRLGLHWHFRCGCPISKPRPVLDFSSKKSGVVFYLFEKSKNELARPKMVFLAILAKIRLFSNNSDTIAKSRLTSEIPVCAFEFSNFLQKSFVCTSYSLYFSLSIDTNFDERDQFSSKKTATGLPKKSICRETEALQKHLRPPY